MTSTLSKLVQAKSILVIEVENQDTIDLNRLELMKSSLEDLYGMFLEDILPGLNLQYSLPLLEIKDEYFRIEVQPLITYFYEPEMELDNDILGSLLDFSPFLFMLYSSWTPDSLRWFLVDAPMWINLTYNFFQVIHDQPDSRMILTSIGENGKIETLSVDNKDLTDLYKYLQKAPV